MSNDQRRLSGSSYSFYSFPSTPRQRSSPSSPSTANRKPPKLQRLRSPTTPTRDPITPSLPPEATSRSFPPSVSSSDMASRSAPKLPSTPTRSGRNPASTQTPKLSSAQSSKTKTPSGPPKLGAKGDSSKSTASPRLPPRPKQADQAGGSAKKAASQAGEKAEKAKSESDDSASDVQQRIGLEDNDRQSISDADDEKTPNPGKLNQSQKVEESTDSFQEIDPHPESDDEDRPEPADVQQDRSDDDEGENGADEADEADEAAEDDEQKSAAGGMTGGVKGLAGKTAGAVGKTAQGAKDTAGGAAKNVGKTAGGVKDTAQGTAGKATEGDAKGAAEEVTGGAKKTGRDAVDTVQDTAGDAKDTAEDAVDETTDGVKDVAPKQAGDAVESTKDTAEGAVDKTKDTTDAAVDQAQDTADDAVDQAQDTAEDTVDKAENTANDVVDQAKGTAEEATDDLPLDFSILKGLKIGRDGNVFDDEGNHVGQVKEGDPSDLADYEVGDDGEILDDDGDLIGRVGLTDEAKEVAQQKAGEAGDKASDAADEVEDTADQAQHASDDIEDAAEDAADEAGDAAEEAKETYLPDISILKGLTVEENGDIYDKQGKLVGRVTEGDPSYLVDQELNEEGEVLDEDGDAIGRAEVVPQEVEDAAEDAEETADKVEDDAEQATDDAVGKSKEELPQAIVPDLSILQSRKINKKGRILDDEGEPIGQLTEDSDLRQCVGKIPNEEGEVLNDDGEVVGHVEVVEGEPAEELMKELHPELAEKAEQAEEQAEDNVPDLSSLEGYKVNKKGEIMNEDGEPLAKLVDGDPAECAGKKVNDQGEVLDKEGNVIGKVELLGAAAEQADETAEDAEESAEEQKPDLSGLEGLKVNKKGQVLNEDGEPIAEVAEGEVSDMAGKKIDDQGQVLDKDGNVIGTVKYLDQGEEEKEEEDKPEAEDEKENKADEEEHPDSGYEDGADMPDIKTLEGLKTNKQGYIVDSDGNHVGKVIEGDARKLWKAGYKLDGEGQFWNDRGQVVGRAEALPREDKDEEAPFAGLEGLLVVKGGFVQDENGNKVGKLVEGDEKKLVGRAVDEDGDILDKRGNAVGRAERWEEEEEAEPDKPDLSILKGLTLNKQGNVIGTDGVPVARLVEGNPKELAGRKCDEEGQIWNDSGKVVGRCELIPDDEREQKQEGPFAGLEGLHVVKGGMVEDEEGNTVGQVVDGDPKKLVGRAVDEDGDIIDRYGNVKGHAEPYEEPEEAADDLSSLEGKTVNKAGNVVDEHGTVYGRISSGDPKKLAGRKVDGQGQIWSDNGKVIGRAELVPGDEQQLKSEGPFSAFDDLTVDGEGNVLSGGEIVGRVIEGDAKKLKGRRVDEDGDILDRNGNSIGKAERWEPEKKERRRNPMAGRKVNKQGEVVDENGDVIGRLTAGDLGRCIGCEINDNGDVIDNDENKIGECTLLENIQEEEEEEVEEEMSEEEQKAHHDAELAKKMNGIVQQTIERMEPICKEITDHIEKADRTPREELDEDDLVNKVKPLIEEGGRILQECNGALRGLDPDGSIAAKAKANAAGRDATDEEYALANSLKELTTNIIKTIDNAKKRIADMPHAKKKLNPLWGLLTEPLFQIIAAVGLLLAGVLGLVGRLLNGLGLGSLVNGLLGGLGIDKLLGGLGLGSITEALGMGGKKKK